MRQINNWEVTVFEETNHPIDNTVSNLPISLDITDPVFGQIMDMSESVSYTHLTLPTICSV